VIVGANKVYPHEGKDYHIQVEDLGTGPACLEVRVYIGGAVLWRKQIPYKDVLERSLPQVELEEELRGLMDKTIHTVQAGIAKGKIA
jgi:hypothetical protein